MSKIDLKIVLNLVLAAALGLGGAGFSRAADQPAGAAAEAPAESAPPAAAEAAPADPQAPADDSLDVTITGEAKDEIPITKEPPSLDVPFPEVTPLAREGQTERTLAEEVQHMTPEQQVQLVEMNSSQTVSPAMVRLPRPPFFRMEMPLGVAALFSSSLPADQKGQWEYQVLNQQNKIVHTARGTEWPQRLFEWDGNENGLMAVKAGPAYTPKLIVTDGAGKTQQFYGDSAQLDVVQYEQDGLLHVEFNNERLYERGSADFSPEMELLIRAALDVLRIRVGTPLRIIVYETTASSALAKKRLDKWKNFVQDKLMVSGDDITLLTMPPGDRGLVTSLMMMEKP